MPATPADSACFRPNPLSREQMRIWLNAMRETEPERHDHVMPFLVMIFPKEPDDEPGQ